MQIYWISLRLGIWPGNLQVLLHVLLSTFAHQGFFQTLQPKFQRPLEGTSMSTMLRQVSAKWPAATRSADTTRIRSDCPQIGRGLNYAWFCMFNIFGWYLWVSSGHPLEPWDLALLLPSLLHWWIVPCLDLNSYCSLTGQPTIGYIHLWGKPTNKLTV